METLVVNLFGGPGSGKSTTCAGIFERLKLKGINCEMAMEYAKDKVWEESFKTLDDQIYVFGKQLHKIKRLLGKVDVIITDAPLLMSIIYDSERNKYFEELIYQQHCSLDNLNFYIKRNDFFQQEGRIQNLEESKLIDNHIISMLKGYQIKYTLIDKEGASDTIEEIVYNKLKEYKI